MARLFDGTDDHIDFSTAAALFLSTWTCSTIVKFAANITTERMIVTKFDTSYLGKIFLGHNFDGTQNSIYALQTRATTGNISRSTANVITAGQWNFIASTADGGTNAPKLYASALGTAVAETTYAAQTVGSGAFIGSNAALCMVGARSTLDVGQTWPGDIAETGLWNRILSADELKALSLGFSPLCFPQGLLFYAPLIGRYSPEANLAPGGDTWGTVTGATVADHPRIIYPSRTGGHRYTPASTLLYSRLERGTRGLGRGIYTGGTR